MSSLRRLTSENDDSRKLRELGIPTCNPEVASLEDHFLKIKRAIEEVRPARLVIDTLSALERVATSRALLDFMIALGSLLRQHEITALLTSAPTGRTTATITPAMALEVGSSPT
jgi:circadian clock protein KaiC